MAAPQTVLTSCQIGDMGHPRTVRGNPIDIYHTHSMVIATHIALKIVLNTFLLHTHCSRCTGTTPISTLVFSTRWHLLSRFCECHSLALPQKDKCLLKASHII